MKKIIYAFIYLLFIPHVGYGEQANMSFNKIITQVSTTDIEQELVQAKEFIKNYKHIDNRLIQLDKEVNFSSLFTKKNKAIKSFTINNATDLDIPIKDENGNLYQIFGVTINEYKNEIDDVLSKKVYQITIMNKDTPITIIDNKPYATSGIVFTIMVVSGAEGSVIAQSKLIKPLLNTSMSIIPYIKDSSGLGELALKNSYFSMEREWNMVWIDNNVLVYVSSRDIPEEKIIKIAKWINEYIK